MDEAGARELRDLFAQELSARGLLLPTDEQELILQLCVSRYLADRPQARCA